MLRLRLALGLALVGCYSPSPPAGAPCSSSGECPSGLTCGIDGLCGGAAPIDGGGDGGSDAGSSTGDPLAVHVRFGFQMVAPDGTITLSLDGSDATVFLDDLTQPTLTQNADGSFDFERENASQVYAILFGSVQAFGTTPTYQFLFPTFGGLDRVGTGDSSPLDITLSHGSDLAGGATDIFVTGQRAELDPADGTDPFTFDVDWQDAYALQTGGDAELLDASRGDVLWFVHFDDGSDAYIIDGAANTQLTLIDGATTPVSATFAVPTAQECVHFLADGDGEAGRLSDASGAAAASIETDYMVASQPAVTQTFGAEYALAYGNDDGAGGTTFHYANPFPGEGELAVLDESVTVTRKAGQAQLTLEAELKTEMPLAAGLHTCGIGQPVVTVPTGVATISGVHLNNKNLGGDNTFIQQSNGFVNVKLDTTSSGTPVDVYTLVLYDVSGGGFNYVETFYSPSSTIPVATPNFQKQHEYLFYLGTQSGFGNAGSGDLSTLTGPWSAYSIPSFTFNVQGL